MKIIKYRVWDKYTKTFIHFDMSNPMFDDTENTVAFNCNSVIGERDPDGDRYTFLLFTGLTDKANVDIYEGDILKDGEIISLIEWDAHNSGFYSPKTKTENAWVNCEVVGNKYTHPELL